MENMLTFLPVVKTTIMGKVYPRTLCSEFRNQRNVLNIHPNKMIQTNLPGDSRGIIKYHSNQCVSCWKRWRTDELVDVLCPSGACEKVFWWFLDLSQFVSN